MNISGSAGGWIPTNEKSKADTTTVVERKPINVVKELKSLKDLYDKLDAKHKEMSNKDLNDALVSVDAAIRALNNIKN